jgi:glycosyltransferase involved in cell wall biosynthesis
MRILMISHAADRTGAPISALQLAKAMTGLGHELKVILRRDGELADTYRKTTQTYTWRKDTQFNLLDGLGTAFRFDPIMAAKCLRSPDRPYCLGRHDRQRTADIRREILNWQPEIIYANTTHCGDVIDDLDLRIPIVTHVREMGPTIMGLDPRRRKSALKKSAMFLCASRSVMDDLSRDFALPAAKLRVESPAVEISVEQIAAADAARTEVESHLGLSEQDTLILGAGSLIPRKGPDLFVEAAKAALDAHEGVGRLVFVWLGDGQMMPDLQKRVQDANIQANVLFPGLVASPFPYFRRASALLVTSREDPYPRVAIEAGALGVPVLAFAGGGGAADLVRDYDAGSLIANFDAVAMGRDIAQLIKIRKSPDKNLSKRVSEGHNPSASASRIVTLFQSLAATLGRME